MRRKNVAAAAVLMVIVMLASSGSAFAADEGDVLPDGEDAEAALWGGSASGRAVLWIPSPEAMPQAAVNQASLDSEEQAAPLKDLIKSVQRLKTLMEHVPSAPDSTAIFTAAPLLPCTLTQN